MYNIWSKFLSTGAFAFFSTSNMHGRQLYLKVLRSKINPDFNIFIHVQTEYGTFWIFVYGGYPLERYSIVLS